MQPIHRFSVFGCLRPSCVALLLASIALGACTLSLNPTNLRATTVNVPDGAEGIGFDDLRYDAALGKVLVPAAETGDLDLIDPETLKVTTISGFSVRDSTDPQRVGTTSVTTARGLVFALDQAALQLDVVDPVAGVIITSTSVLTAPDYIRYVASTGELWVTEKSLEQIEVFTLSDAMPPMITATAVITVPNGPESLLIDETRGRAYTNQPKIGMTAVIDLKTRALVAQWGNGCTKARGMALDEVRGYLFVACNEGKVVMLDADGDGLHITSENFGAGIDFVAYNPRLQHVYLPSSKSGLLAIFGVTYTTLTDTTTLTVPAPGTVTATLTPTIKIGLIRLGTADTNLKAKCVVADDHDDAWVCDPSRGQVLRVRDTFPASEP